jgi:hypothetical protein
LNLGIEIPSNYIRILIVSVPFDIQTAARGCPAASGGPVRSGEAVDHRGEAERGGESEEERKEMMGIYIALSGRKRVRREGEAMRNERSS